MRNRKAPWVTGLEEFGLSRRALRQLGSRQVVVDAFLDHMRYVYPSPAMFKKLLALSPQERRRTIRDWQMSELKKLRRETPFADQEVIRRGRDIVCLRLTLPASGVHRLLKLKHADGLRIVTVSGVRRRKGRRAPKATARLFAVMARFSEQLEGQTKGSQLCEERIYLLMAKSERDARHRAEREFRQEVFPVLGRSGYFHRRAYEGIVDVCEPFEELFSAKGTEVYYRYEERPVRRKDEWHPGRSARSTRASHLALRT